jgi:hypothetical protein
MAERSSTPRARRMVAGLVERYFLALKRELAKQTDGFWMRVENAVATKTPDENIHDRVEAQQSDADKVLPAAGPHAKPDLTDGERTPGAGTLPSPSDKKADTGNG